VLATVGCQAKARGSPRSHYQSQPKVDEGTGERLLLAAASGNLQQVTKLLELRVGVNHQDEVGVLRTLCQHNCLPSHL
jgi:hypothetical protein